MKIKGKQGVRIEVLYVGIRGKWQANFQGEKLRKPINNFERVPFHSYLMYSSYVVGLPSIYKQDFGVPKIFF